MREKIIHYPFFRRVGYASRNGWFFKRRILWFVLIPWIPSDTDIHIHNVWKDVKNKTPLFVGGLRGNW